MFKLSIVAVVCACALGSSVTCTDQAGGTCTGKCLVNPAAPVKGGSFTMGVNGTCAIAVDKPTFDVHATFGGLPVLDKKGLDGCTPNSITMPLNMGSVDIPAVQCPVPANAPLALTSTAHVSKLAPNGELKGTLVAKLGTKVLFTLDFDAKFP